MECKFVWPLSLLQICCCLSCISKYKKDSNRFAEVYVFYVFGFCLNGLSEDYFPYECNSLIKPIKGIQLKEKSYPKLLLVANTFQVLCLYQEENPQDFFPGRTWCQPCYKTKWSFLYSQFSSFSNFNVGLFLF